MRGVRQESIDWRRRAVALGGLVLLIVLIVVVSSSGGSGSSSQTVQPSATPAPVTGGVSTGPA